jgi:hypothetical protein
MPDNVQLHFVGNTSIPIDVDLEEWARSFEGALQANKVVRIDSPEEARTLAINPRLVTHWTHGA